MALKDKKDKHPNKRGKKRKGKTSKRKRSRYKCIGVTCQVLLYIVNGCVWLVAFFAAGFGLVIALSTNTIGLGEDFSYLDFIVSTPAILFLMYGMLLIFVAIVGCFAAVSAKCCTIVVYCILILLFIAWDATIGLRLSWRLNAYRKFIENLKESMNGYAKADADYVGLIPIPPTVFWDHFQRKGRCCGLDDYVDWKNTSYGTETQSLPDSCCNVEYDCQGCGLLAWKHPDHFSHTLTSVISTRSCLSIFPVVIQKDETQTIDLMGKILIAMLLVCLIFALSLACLVCLKRFRPALGLTNPSFLEAPEDPRLLEERTQTRVYPAGYGQGDHSSRQKKVRFSDSRPYVIMGRDK